MTPTHHSASKNYQNTGDSATTACDLTFIMTKEEAVVFQDTPQVTHLKTMISQTQKHLPQIIFDFKDHVRVNDCVGSSRDLKRCLEAGCGRSAVSSHQHIDTMPVIVASYYYTSCTLLPRVTYESWSHLFCCHDTYTTAQMLNEHKDWNSSCINQHHQNNRLVTKQEAGTCWNLRSNHRLFI